MRINFIKYLQIACKRNYLVKSMTAALHTDEQSMQLRQQCSGVYTESLSSGHWRSVNIIKHAVNKPQQKMNNNNNKNALDDYQQ